MDLMKSLHREVDAAARLKQIGTRQKIKNCPIEQFCGEKIKY